MCKQDYFLTECKIVIWRSSSPAQCPQCSFFLFCGVLDRIQGRLGVSEHMRGQNPTHGEI